MASAILFVALIREAIISALILGLHRVLIGSPARFTTPSHPTIAAAHLDGSANAIVPPENEFRSAFRALSTSRVNTTTSFPPCNRVATKRVPTNPEAPEIATRSFLGVGVFDDDAFDESDPVADANTNVVLIHLCVWPRRAPLPGWRALRMLGDTREDNALADMRQTFVSPPARPPHESVAATSRHALGVSAIARSGCARSSRAPGRGETLAAIARVAP
jgi:hypothetical protein|mmetsp:Transcript_9068/g.33879  ORF Transcript_9068/g.33879 Transcript_9068/m.33879 type:complete len:219 (+) Transcript_9068:8510-9166(+)